MRRMNKALKPWLLALLMGCGAAQAGPLSAIAGDLKIEFGNLDMNTTGYDAKGVGVRCTSVEGCDGVDGISKARGSGQSEDAWGVLSISRIMRGTTTLWTQGEGGNYLTGMFFGAMDHNVTVLPDPFSSRVMTQAYSVGARLRIYRGAVDYYAGAASLGEAGRSGIDAYRGITSEGQNLWLDMIFDLGVDSTEVGQGSSYMNVFSSVNFAGAGQGFLSVVGGEAAKLFDTDTVLNGRGGRSDMKFSTTYKQDEAVPGWQAVSSGDLISHAVNPVPEPMSLSLAGLGLLALGVTRRRHKAA